MMSSLQKLSRCAGVALSLLLATATAAAAPKPFSIEHLLALRRPGDAQISPDGRHVAYSVRTVDVEANRSVSHLWIVPTTGGEPWQLTSHEKGEARPRWSPDGSRLAFLSSRGGSQQLWSIALGGGEAQPLTSLSTGADGHVWSPDGRWLAFTSDVWPDLQGDEAQAKRAGELEASGVKALILDDLLYRRWDSWRGGKRTHVFVVAAAGGAARDVTPGDLDAPPFSLGGPDAYAFSPDARWLAFTRGAARNLEAWTTNTDLCVVDLQDPGAKPKVLTGANRGWDGSPLWSPDGTRIAYRSQEREGYEADRFRLSVLDVKTGRVADLAGDLDRSVDEVLWSPDSRHLVIGVEDEGRAAIHAVDLEGSAGPEGLAQRGPTRKLLDGVSFSGLSATARGDVLCGMVQSLTAPADVAVLSLGPALEAARTLEAPRKLTDVNRALLEEVDMPTVESVRYRGALGADIQAWLLKPPGWTAGTRRPLVLFIHGGPQGAWTDAFSYRWNPALYAAAGYVVLCPNPHGSSGFGQAFTEQISGDWGGACYEDVMKAVDWAIAEGLADPDRLGAMGGSFGGYMVNWILGHTDRFKALVSHAGVYNLESMYGSTEELWFPEWELHAPPWVDRTLYERHSPHLFAARFKTPTLVVHGELDYRVPVAQGIQLFTALRRQGVEARFLYYPDEGHWVLKPKNARLWNETVLGWLRTHLGQP